MRWCLLGAWLVGCGGSSPALGNAMPRDAGAEERAPADDAQDEPSVDAAPDARPEGAADAADVCAPVSCAALYAATDGGCGTFANGCGGIIVCSICPGMQTCAAGACVACVTINGPCGGTEGACCAPLACKGGVCAAP